MATTLVLGAGMVGVSTALALQESGEEVVLVDRMGIGRETSYGNAGCIQTEAVEPHAIPHDAKAMLKIFLKQDNAVNWHLGSIAEHIRPLWAYWKASTPDTYARICDHYAAIMKQAEVYHAPLVDAAKANDLIDHHGYYVLYRDKTDFEEDKRNAQRVYERFEVPYEVLNGEQMKSVYPQLRSVPEGGIHFTHVWTCRSPGGLTHAYGKLFLQRGGQFEYGDAQSLKASEQGYSVLTENGVVSADKVVIALGAWSNTVAERFGYHFPLFRKRGYHRHFNMQHLPAYPIFDKQTATFLSPMNQGLRVCTGAEFTPFDAPVCSRQIDHSEKAARELFELGKPVEETPWFGHRPMLPDMLPVIGEAPHHKGMWFHFGHGHQGFTGGPASAHILLNYMQGKQDELMPAVSPVRFVADQSH